MGIPVVYDDSVMAKPSVIYLKWSCIRNESENPAV